MDPYGYMGGGMGEEVEEGFKATSGAPLADGVAIATEADVIAALQTVYDPEIPVDVYELGLIYKHDISEKGDVAVEMSLTAPGCPVAGELPGWVADAVAKVEGIGQVEVTITWEPAWTPELMSEDAKLALGMD
jgi:FeS assembly SUF system protein